MAKKSPTVIADPPTPPPPKSSAKKAPPKFVTYYLLAYNALSALGWTYVLLLTLIHIFNLDGKSSSIPAVLAPTTSSKLTSWLTNLPWGGPKKLLIPTTSFESSLPAFLRPVYQRTPTTYARLGTPTALVQSLAFLEIVHVSLGWVRSSIQTTTMQVFSRLFLIWGIVERYPSTRTHPLFTSMVFAWSLTEVIRYAFYTANLLHSEPYVLVYLRYTTFYVLYPLGALSEAGLIYESLPKSSMGVSWRTWVTGMWGPWDYLRGVMFLAWFPGLYVMYTHMMKQRRKVLPAGRTLGQKPKTN